MLVSPHLPYRTYKNNGQADELLQQAATQQPHTLIV